MEPAAARPPFFVRVKSAGGGTYAEVDVPGGSAASVARLAALACTASAHWGVGAAGVALSLVDAVGDDLPSPAAEAAAVRVDQVGWTLARAGVGPGAWLIAHFVQSAAAASGGGAAAGGSSPRERFRALLNSAGVEVDDRVMSTIAGSGTLSARVAMTSTVDEACALYSAASAVPHTATRATVQRERGVTIDGEFLVSGVQTALFLRAFEHYVPRVLKVPLRAGAAAAECALWKDVSPHAPPDAFLVPVALIALSHGAVHEARSGPGRSDVMPLREGVLMPAYAGTLADVPKPADAAYVARVVARLEPTLRFLHARGWLHGDVKPGNIFLDFAGDSWLGDFGSSTPIAAAAQGEVAGGTPAYQSEDVSAAHEPLRFDLVGLAAAALELLGLIAPTSAPWSGWPRGALAAAAARIDDATLRVRIGALLAEVAA
jgi:hypothetical protein